MRNTSQKKCDPHTNESDVGLFESTSSNNVPRKNIRRLPLADIRNVQENLSKRFDGK